MPPGRRTNERLRTFVVAVSYPSETSAYESTSFCKASINLDEHGEPHVRKYSSLVLGQLRSPVPVPRDGDPRAWIVEAWTRQIRVALGKPVEPFTWEDYPAMEQLTISTWNVFEPYRTHARPFDFLIVGIISQDRKDIAAHPKSCCKKSRPSRLLFDDPAQWRAQETGAAWAAAQYGTLTPFRACAPTGNSLSARCRQSIVSDLIPMAASPPQ